MQHRNNTAKPQKIKNNQNYYNFIKDPRGSNTNKLKRKNSEAVLKKEKSEHIKKIQLKFESPAKRGKVLI